MDRNIYDNDFEAFLKQKSDQYKMYPSDRVWNNVYSSLHGRKKWWALGFSLLLIGMGLVAGREILMSDYNKMLSGLTPETQTLSPVQSSLQNSPVPSNAHRHVPPTVPGRMTTIQTAQKDPTVLNTDNADNTTNTATTPATAQNNTGGPEVASTGSNENVLVIENNPLPLLSPSPKTGTGVTEPTLSVTQNPLLLHENIKDKNNSTKEEAGKPANQIENAAAKQPLKYSRWSLQYYASPTISYRRLSNVNAGSNNSSNIPVASGDAGNINHYVNHKPATGFELGSNVQYRLSDNLRLFAGAQLNYSRYYIDAFKYHTEKASIALNNSQVHDTVSGYTDIRNFSGYAPEQLQNKYLQLSLPVGIEIKLLGRKKLQFSVAGGVQPTFLLTSTSYLISSDYKNYIQSPDLARNFNVHTNFEAFVSYTTGGLRWQIGPQFRSQLLSSYSNQYRVREYLTEYGIKFGVTKSF